jgi:glycosyltransferase involved in cell wall biosynthesis
MSGPRACNFPEYPGRLAVQQRVLPTYRAPFFDTLAASCRGGLSVFAGLPQPDEHIPPAPRLEIAHLVLSDNRPFMDIRSPFYQVWQPGIIDWLEAWQPDALIVEANPRYRSTPQAIRWMHARRCPVLGWGLGSPSLTGALAGWRSLARRRFVDRLDGVVAYSRQGAEEYVRMGLAPERVFVAPNAAAPRPHAPPPLRPERPAGALTVLFVGRLQARKRIDDLLRACGALPAALQPALTIVGEGPARSEFEALAGRIYPRARFTGAAYGPDLAAYFTQADLFVLPGTGGLAVQQAMAYGLPVLVAEGDGTQSDLVRPTNGWTIPPGDPGALQAILEEALSDLPRLRRMGAESYRIVADEINLQTMAARFVEAVNGVTALGLWPH